MLLSLPLAACASQAAPGPTPSAQPTPGTAHLSGTVTVSPCRPVERPSDPPCPPVAGMRVTFQGAGNYQATSDKDGRYSLALPSGHYHVSAGNYPARAYPAEVDLKDGAQTIDLSVDTGIR